MELRAPACRGAAGVKAVRAPRAAGSGATPPRPARNRAAETVGAGQAWGLNRADLRSPGRPEKPLCTPRLLLPAASRAPKPSGAQNPGTPAFGAAADASPGGARGRDAWTRVRPPRRAGTGRATQRPGAGSARLQLAAQGLPSAGASCSDLGRVRANEHARLAVAARGPLFRVGEGAVLREGGAGVVWPHPVEPRRRVPRVHTRRTTSDGRVEAWVVGGRDSGAPGQVGKNREVSLPGVESPARGEGVRRGPPGSWSGTRGQDAELWAGAGQGLRSGLQRELDLVLSC